MEPLDQFWSVIHENSLEFSVQSNGTISNSPRVSLEKLRPKTVWTDGTQTLTQPNLTLEPLDQFQTVLHEYSLEILINNKFWAHFKVELKLFKSCLGEFWIMGFIWLSYSANGTFIESKFSGCGSKQKIICVNHKIPLFKLFNLFITQILYF